MACNGGVRIVADYWSTGLSSNVDRLELLLRLVPLLTPRLSNPVRSAQVPYKRSKAVALACCSFASEHSANSRNTLSIIFCIVRARVTAYLVVSRCISAVCDFTASGCAAALAAAWAAWLRNAISAAFSDVNRLPRVRYGVIASVITCPALPCLSDKTKARGCQSRA